jgi:tRNA dimethylallyltransferase
VSRRRVIFVGGPTAAGKSDLAYELAERGGFEIVSADSVQVYRGFDIGSAKPGPEIRARIPHHLVDIIEPDDTYSAGRFVRDAEAAIAGIHRSGRTPIVVGGTGLYLRSLLYGISSAPSDPAVRSRIRHRLEQEGVGALHAELENRDPEAAARIAPSDAVRVARALEVHEITGERLSTIQARDRSRAPRFDALVLTVTRRREILEARIEARVREMLGAGLVDEVVALRARGVSAQSTPMRTVGYLEVNQFLDGVLGEAVLPVEIVVSTRRLAKRQLTWFRGQWSSRWIDAESVAERDAALEAGHEFARGALVRPPGTEDDAHLRR